METPICRFEVGWHQANKSCALKAPFRSLPFLPPNPGYGANLVTWGPLESADWVGTACWFRIHHVYKHRISPSIHGFLLSTDLTGMHLHVDPRRFGDYSPHLRTTQDPPTQIKKRINCSTTGAPLPLGQDRAPRHKTPGENTGGRSPCVASEKRIRWTPDALPRKIVIGRIETKWSSIHSRLNGISTPNQWIHQLGWG
jgi:hypothetical protein